MVSGRVQGVGFRIFVRGVARELELRGWVRNLPDGRSVEAVAQGRRGELDALASAIRAGPPGSVVRSFREERAEVQPGLREFDLVF